jgi:hypothetical protein
MLVDDDDDDDDDEKDCRLLTSQMLSTSNADSCWDGTEKCSSNCSHRQTNQRNCSI